MVYLASNVRPEIRTDVYLSKILFYLCDDLAPRYDRPAPRTPSPRTPALRLGVGASAAERADAGACSKPGDSVPDICFCRNFSQVTPNIVYLCTVGPLIIESLRAKKRVSTGALRALDDPLVVQTKI